MCGNFANMAKNVQVFFVNMVINVRVFVLSKLQGMCGEFINMAMDVGIFFCQYGNDYNSFSIWQRIFMLIQYGNKFAAMYNVLMNMGFIFSTLMNVQCQ
jgi:hypothetical protein